jgi:hypothetical protein
MKTILAIALLSLVGCSTYNQHVPVDVAIMPTDCANRMAITRWLEQQSSVPRQSLQSETDYARQRSQIRHRLWTLRYNCQSL